MKQPVPTAAELAAKLRARFGRDPAELERPRPNRYAPRMAPEDQAALLAAYAAGGKVTEIAQRFGVSRAYPAWLAAELGLPRRPIGRTCKRYPPRAKTTKEPAMKQPTKTPAPHKIRARKNEFSARTLQSISTQSRDVKVTLPRLKCLEPREGDDA